MKEFIVAQLKKFVSKEFILGQLKKWIYDILIKKIFGAALGGIQGFVVKFIFGKIWGRYLKPMLQKMWRFGKRKLRARKLKKIGKRTAEATTEEEHDAAVDDLFK